MVQFSQLNIFSVHWLYWPSFVYWTFVYDTYAFWTEQTRWPSMTRSREFPITPVWMIVRFLQVNFIEKLTKLDQKAVKYSVLTGYGLYSVPRQSFGFGRCSVLSGYGLDRFDFSRDSRAIFWCSCQQVWLNTFRKAKWNIYHKLLKFSPF